MTHPHPLGNTPPALAASASTARVLVLVDESGSMASHLGGTIEQLNSYLDSLARLPGVTLVTVATFATVHGGGNGYRERFRDVPAQGTQRFVAHNWVEGRLPYTPGGGTPLFDAIGKIVNSVPDTKPALVAILTDGAENESREWNRNGVAELLKNREAKGWTFAFLMAGFDKMAAELMTQAFGGHAANTMSYQKGMEAQASVAASVATATWRSNGAVTGEATRSLYSDAGVEKDLAAKKLP